MNSLAESKKTFSKIYQCYRTLMSQDVIEYESERSRLVFPILPIPILTELCNISSKIFADEQIILNLKGNYVIIGDLHGHILDLFRILRRFGHPPKQNYLFLGDIVDRGEFSTETIVLILLMKCLYPDNVFLLRGNHEFTELWPTCGFIAELETIYNNSQTPSSIFMKVFSFLPLGAIINDKYLCVHGGIGPEMPSIQQLMLLERPIYHFDTEPVLSIVWSDLSNTIKEFEPSNRGTGYLYGEPALESYLESQNLETLIRGHECVIGGVEFSIKKKCITVFSASNYCGVTENDAGVLIVTPDELPKRAVLKALIYLRRENASYLKSSSETSFLLSSKPINLNSPDRSSYFNANHNSPIQKLKKNPGCLSPVQDRSNLYEFPSSNTEICRPRQIHSNPSAVISKPGSIRRSFDRSMLIREKEQFPVLSPSMMSTQPTVALPSSPNSGSFASMRRPSRPRSAKKRSSIQSLPPTSQLPAHLPIQQPSSPIEGQRKRRNNRLSLGDNLSRSQPQFENIENTKIQLGQTPSSPIAPRMALFKEEE